MLSHSFLCFLCFFAVLTTCIGGDIMIATWNNEIIAESDKTVVVEGNHYFPAESVKMDYFSKSDTTTTCPWKGVANYYDINVGGKTNKDAAWYYPTTKPDANHIKGMVAFWKGVTVKKQKPSAEL